MQTSFLHLWNKLLLSLHMPMPITISCLWLSGKTNTSGNQASHPNTWLNVGLFWGGVAYIYIHVFFTFCWLTNHFLRPSTNVRIWLHAKDGVVRIAPYAPDEQLTAAQRWSPHRFLWETCDRVTRCTARVSVAVQVQNDVTQVHGDLSVVPSLSVDVQKGLERIFPNYGSPKWTKVKRIYIYMYIYWVCPIYHL